MSDTLPAKIQNAYWFQAFNAASWQICLGSPLILFARELGAPAVVLGILTGIGPLTLVLQLFVARYAERIGYRNLMLRGWSTRVAVLSVLMVLPLASPYIGAMTAVYAMVAVIFVFAVSKAVGISAWMPWVAAIVPRSVRGYYLSRDRAFISMSTLLTLAGSGVLLLGHSLTGYSIVFLIGFLAGVVSLFFLRRIPDPIKVVPVNEVPSDATRLGWRNVFCDIPFMRLILFSVAVQGVVTGSATFTLIFAREQVGLGDGVILWLTAGASLVGLFALQMLRHRADRTGSKPLLAFVLCWWVCYYLLWFALSINLINNRVLSVVLIMVTAGFFASMYDLAMTRLLMNLAGDRQGSAHYFALYSVIVSAVAGLGPIIWGSLLDILRDTTGDFLGFRLNQYSYVFALQFILLIFVGVMLAILREPNARQFRNVVVDAFVTSPARVLSQISTYSARLFRRNR
jgi:MFS family permease